jgi:hypothetical protein
MKLRVLIALLALCVITPVAAPAAMPAGPSGAIMATIDGAIAAINAGNAAETNSYFTSSSLIVDEFPPYVWSGTGAAGTWWRHVDAANTQMHNTHFRAAVGHITHWNASRVQAYVVVPLTISFVAKGKPGGETGLWTLTMQRVGTAWRIHTASWATVSNS